MKKILVIALLLSAVFTQTSDDCLCCTEEYQQFHFWIGEWTVYDTTDNILGTNTITIDQDNCLMIENWKSSSSDFTGSSYNYYNKSDSTWNQTWVDNKGDNLKLEGNFVDSKMVLSSELREDQDSGGKFYHQISWTPKSDGTVIQRWDVISENNELLYTAFLGIYKKINKLKY